MLKKIVPIVALSLTTQSLISAVLFNQNFDSFADSTTAVTNMIFDPAMWSVQTDTTFGTDKVLETSQTQQNAAGTFSSTTLASGDGIALNVNYRWNGTPPNDAAGNFIRIGLFNSGGTTGDHNATVYGDDSGYLADATYYGSPTQFGFSLRTEQSISTAFSEILLDTLPTTDMVNHGDSSKVGDNGSNFHTVSLALQKTGSAVNINIFFDDPTFTGLPAHSIVDSSNTITTFDSFFIRTAGSLNASGTFQIEKIRVETIPEPKVYATIFGFVILIVSIVRNRRIDK